MLISNYRDFLASAVELGTKFISAAEFCAPELKSCSLIKHDVHHAFATSVEMAILESELAVTSTFYFMEPTHKLLQKFSKTHIEETISTIANLGHCIGIHLDIHDTLEKHGDLYHGIANIKEWLDECRD